MTLSTQAVLRALLQEPTRDQYGLQLCAATGLPSGTLHPILARLEHLGWIESDWEGIDPQKEGRPRRRYYHLTADGVASARSAVAQAHAERARMVGRYRPVGRTPLGETS